METQTCFYLRPGKKAEAPVYLRVRTDNGTFAAVVKGLFVPQDSWPSGKNAQHIIEKMLPRLGQIAAEIRSADSSSLTQDTIKDIIADSEDRAAAEAKREQRRRLSFVQYFELFISELKSGVRKSERGTDAAPLTIVAYQQVLNRLIEYQSASGLALNWHKIDNDFLKSYFAWLQSPERGQDCFSVNTCAKHLKRIKRVFKAAKEERIIDIDAPDYKCAEVAVDSVYLTEQELEAFAAADLAGLPKGYETARDLFLVGAYTGQRVSDYINIQSDQIHTDKEGRVFITIIQQKTGKKVVIPAKRELRTILAKYDNILPSMCDQVLNRYIKTIAKRGGINEVVEYKSTKGGKEHKLKAPKYQLISSHTARRSCATLLYLAGVDSVDIQNITGHSDQNTLKRYIKSTPEENAQRMANQIRFFD